MTEIARLRDHLPGLEILTASEDAGSHSRVTETEFAHPPAAVIFPRTTGEVSQVMQFAGEARIPVLTRGSQQGIRESKPETGGILISLARMNRILEFDARNLTLRAEAGAMTRTIASAAGDADLFYPPESGFDETATIGGSVEENAGGLRGWKYGVTRDYVMGLQVVLASGDVLSTGNKCVKDVAGYPLKDLFIGTEGTLGIITEVLLKLIPRPPSRKSLFAAFASAEDAAVAAAAILAARVIPATLELLTAAAINRSAELAGFIPSGGTGAGLLMESDGHPAAVDEEAQIMADLAKQHGAASIRTASDPEDAALRKILSETLRPDSNCPPTCGSTLAGEHLTIRPQAENGVAIMRRMKAAFDPEAMLNPGRTPALEAYAC
ncbi:MAG TPA: FAD-binding protein [Terrimicrobiaceae bacterium]|nr:FAD-binding protein [Terrimicrobiaceae bacterium]